jgi:Matrixin
MKNRRIATTALMLLLVGAGSVHAMMVEMTPAELQSRADLIVTGAVTGLASHWDDSHSSIYTDVTVNPGQVSKGSVDRQVVVRVPGGEVDDIGMWVEDMPAFSVGQQVTLYLARTSTPAVFRLVAGEQGVAIDGRAPVYYSYSGYHRDPASCYYYVWSGLPAGWNPAIQSGASTWSDAGSAFRFYYNGTTSASGTVYDGQNTVSSGDLGSSGILAQNTYWYTRRGKLVVENDIVFNTRYAWSTSGEAGKYDVQNIGTHELGHCLVLDDLYKSYQSELTMYGYGATGETKKSTLETGDVDGIKHIYGTGLFQGKPGATSVQKAVTD